MFMCPTCAFTVNFNVHVYLLRSDCPCVSLWGPWDVLSASDLRHEISKTTSMHTLRRSASGGHGKFVVVNTAGDAELV